MKTLALILALSGTTLAQSSYFQGRAEQLAYLAKDCGIRIPGGVTTIDANTGQVTESLATGKYVLYSHDQTVILKYWDGGPGHKSNGYIDQGDTISIQHNTGFAASQLGGNLDTLKGTELDLRKAIEKIVSDNNSCDKPIS